MRSPRTHHSGSVVVLLGKGAAAWRLRRESNS
jgi:hypothetical protein